MDDDTQLHKHPAIQAYRDGCHRYPPKPMYEEVIDEVGEKPEHVELLRDVAHDWAGRGWNPSNARGILDVFKDRRGTETPLGIWTDPETGLRYQLYADGYRELLPPEETT